MKQLKELYKYRTLIIYLTWGRIKQGERNKLLGGLWSLINPLALLGIYYFIFDVVFSSRIENFVLYLFAAIIAWRFFSQSVRLSSVIIPANRGLIGEAYFPKAVLPISVVLMGVHDYLYGFLTLMLMSIFMGVSLTPLMIFWPVVFLVEVIFTLGISLVAANVGVFFRDLQNILEIVFRLLFYLSGTMYSISRIPEAWQFYFRLNPVYILYESYRNILLSHEPPPALLLSSLALLSFIVFLGGLRLMAKSEGKYIKYL